MDNECDCHFNVLGFDGYSGSKRGGLGNEGEVDAPRCLTKCKEEYLDMLWADANKTMQSVCMLLTTEAPDQRLWPLYWCGSTFCGVQISQAGPLGQDPNVDWIINSCQNIGYHSVLDPGPPPPPYKCRKGTEGPASGPSQPCRPIQLPNSLLLTVSTSWAAPAATPWVAISSQHGTTMTTTTTSGTQSATITSASTISSSPQRDTSTHTEKGLDTAAKTAVVVCSVAGLLALTGFVLLLVHCCRRKQQPGNSKKRPPMTRHSGSEEPAMPLVPSAQSKKVALGTPIPPLRLRERDILPPILRLGRRAPSPPLTPLTLSDDSSHRVFPSSPICSPTSTKLVPRHERPRTPRSLTLPLPLPLPHELDGKTEPRNSLSSYAASSLTAHSSRYEGCAPGTRTVTDSPPSSTAPRHSLGDPRSHCAVLATRRPGAPHITDSSYAVIDLTPLPSPPAVGCDEAID